jgi:hypothetical protein
MLPLWIVLKHLWKHRMWLDWSAPLESRLCTLCGTYLLTGTTEPYKK